MKKFVELVNNMGEIVFVDPSAVQLILVLHNDGFRAHIYTSATTFVTQSFSQYERLLEVIRELDR